MKHIIEGAIERMRIRGRRSKQLLDDLKEKRGYCNLKGEALLALCGELALER